MVYCLSWILWVLRWLSVTGFIRNYTELKAGNIDHPEILRRWRRCFIDIWCLISFLMSAIAAIYARPLWILCFGFLRLYEILMCQAGVLFMTDIETSTERTTQENSNPRRLLLNAILNYIEVVFWFAAIYSYWGQSFNTDNALPLNCPINTICFSLVTMTTLGYGDIRPIDEIGAFFVLIHLVFAVFLTLMVLARFVSFLPSARNKS